jgi:hypothetical protein
MTRAGLPRIRLGVCGGRYFRDVPMLWRVLDTLIFTPSLVVDGASDDVTGPYMGADYWANQWAVARQIPTLRIHADWKRLGKAAGPIRNGQILKEIDRLVAFAGGRGTADMVRRAVDAGLDVASVRPDGSLKIESRHDQTIRKD